MNVYERFKNNEYLLNPIVKGLHRRFSRFFQLKELYQWGSIGLFDASKKFSGNEEEFHFYANVRIRGSIIDEIRKESLFVRRAGVDEQPKFTYCEEPEYDHAYSDTSFENKLIAREKLSQIINGLDHLTPRLRNVFIWTFFEKIEQADIALVIGLSEPRVSQLKKKAIKALAKMGVEMAA